MSTRPLLTILLALLLASPLVVAQTVDADSKIRVGADEEEFAIKLTVNANQNGTHILRIEDRPGFDVTNNEVRADLIQGDAAIYEFNVKRTGNSTNGEFVFQYVLSLDSPSNTIDQGQVTIAIGTGGLGSIPLDELPVPAPSAALLCAGLLGIAIIYRTKQQKLP